MPSLFMKKSQLGKGAEALGQLLPGEFTASASDLHAHLGHDLLVAVIRNSKGPAELGQTGG